MCIFLRNLSIFLLISSCTASDANLDQPPGSSLGDLDFSGVAAGVLLGVPQSAASEQQSTASEQQSTAAISLSTDVMPRIGINEEARIRASRSISSDVDSLRDGVLGIGIVAFPRSPTGELRQRAENICNGFLRSLADQEDISLRFGSPVQQQVVTVWPIENQREFAPVDWLHSDPCDVAVRSYDQIEGIRALDDAVAFFDARGKTDIVERLFAVDGPWLFAWRPGASKGTQDPDLLVLAFDLSYVSTRQEAERVFQAWRNAIENNEKLWTSVEVSNVTWHSAIIEWANLIGRDLPFYEKFFGD